MLFHYLVLIVLSEVVLGFGNADRRCPQKTQSTKTLRLHPLHPLNGAVVTDVRTSFKCCPGYAGKNCDPICMPPCMHNTKCLAPNTCCRSGYKAVKTHGDNFKCESLCFIQCPENSSCDPPFNCQCNTGYVPSVSSRDEFTCEPACPRNCQPYGKCLKPHECTCYDGYELSADGDHMCTPKCSSQCLHGHCIAPETCFCDPGYLMGPDGSCQPVCHELCLNGKCSAPDQCTCNEGYRLANETNLCVPICDPDCINGLCIAPNVCICSLNYQPEHASSHKCVPVCDECEQSDCIEPNVCLPTPDPNTALEILNNLTQISGDQFHNLKDISNVSKMKLKYTDVSCQKCKCWKTNLLDDECISDCSPSDDCLQLENCLCPDMDETLMSCDYKFRNESYSLQFQCDTSLVFTTLPVGIIKTDITLQSLSEVQVFLMAFLTAGIIVLSVLIIYWIRKGFKPRTDVPPVSYSLTSPSAPMETGTLCKE